MSLENVAFGMVVVLVVGIGLVVGVRRRNLKGAFLQVVLPAGIVAIIHHGSGSHAEKGFGPRFWLELAVLAGVILAVGFVGHIATRRRAPSDGRDDSAPGDPAANGRG